jgi:hypothetical protein
MAIVLTAGCSKEKPAAGQVGGPAEVTPAAPASPPPPSRGAPTAVAPTPVVVPESADVNSTLSRLTLELRKYVIRTRSVPKNFEEFVANARIQVPPPPAGRKYAIQNQAVVLAKQ